MIVTDVCAEAFLGGGWVDLSSKVMQRDSVGIQIIRGYRGDAGSLAPSSVSFELNNEGGLFSPHNPTSPYYGHLKENTPLRVSIRDVVVDNFGTPAVDGWGSTDTGEAWSTSGSGGTVANSNWQKAAGVGTVLVPVADAFRRCSLSTLLERDMEVAFDVSTSVGVPTGASVQVVLAWREGGTPYQTHVEIQTDGTVRVYGAFPDLSVSTPDVIPGVVNAPGVPLRVRAQIEGRTLRARVWPSADPEPLEWHHVASSNQAGDTAAAFGSFSLVSAVTVGNADAPVTFTFDRFEVRYPRACTEIGGWPESWDSTGNDAVVQVDSGGVMRRLGTGNQSPIRSSLYRGVVSNSPESLIAYWPCEDESGAESLASALGGTPMGFTVWVEGDTPNLASSDQWMCSAPIPTFGGAEFRADIPPYTHTGELQVRYLLNVPEVDEAATGQAISQMVFSSGTVRRIDLQYVEFLGQPALRMLAFDDTQTQIFDSTPSTWNLKDPWQVRVFIEVSQVGANIEMEYAVAAVDPGARLYAVGGILPIGSVAGTLGTLRQILFNPQGGYDEVAVGHVAVHTAITSRVDELAQLRAHTGESAVSRFQRLCREEGITQSTLRADAPSTILGGQQRDTLLKVLESCAESDGGAMLYEPKGALGLEFRARGSLENQDPIATVDYSAGHLQAPFRPVTDDQRLVNGWTVKRDAGSFGRYEQLTGPKSVLSLEEGGIGRREDSITVHIQDDSELLSQASWRVHRDTVHVARFPEMTVNLAAEVGLPRVALLSTNVGDRVQVDNTESIYQFDGVSQLVLGYREQLRSVNHEIVFNCVPELPYRVVVLDDDEARADTDGSELAAAATNTATTLKVMTRNMHWRTAPPWTIDPTQFPFDIRVAGERCTVTAITDTVSFVGVGTASHAANAAVIPGLPAGWQAGDLLLLWGATRDSAQAVPVTPSGYVELTSGGENARLYSRVAQAGDTAPTMIFSGAGAPGMSVSAQMCAFRSAGGWSDLSRIVTGQRGQLNASAQNLAYPYIHAQLPGCLVLHLGWKQDDWTSAAGSGTEIGEFTTTLGDDQGMWWGYTLLTSPGDDAGADIVITGGAAAISRGISLVIHPDVQAATVTRSINGVVKAQSAGAEVELWHRPTIGL